MNQKKECKHCQQSIPLVRNSKFCGQKECQKDRTVLANKKTYLKHRTKRLIYAREYIKKLWATKKQKKLICVTCRIEFNFLPNKPNSKTCSSECSLQLKRKLWKRANTLNNFSKKNKQGNFCCAEAIAHLKTPHCAFCNKLLKNPTPNQKFCSKECYKEKMSQMFKEVRAKFIQKRTAYHVKDFSKSPLIYNQQKEKPCIT